MLDQLAFDQLQSQARCHRQRRMLAVDDALRGLDQVQYAATAPARGPVPLNSLPRIRKFGVLAAKWRPTAVAMTKAERGRCGATWTPVGRGEPRDAPGAGPAPPLGGIWLDDVDGIELQQLAELPTGRQPLTGRHGMTLWARTWVRGAWALSASHRLLDPHRVERDQGIGESMATLEELGRP